MSSKTVTFVECIGENGPMTPEQCAQWLDAKWARHGELEDKASAQMIRNLVTTAQGMREDYRRFREALERGRDYLQGEFYAEALGILDDALSGDSSPVETTTKQMLKYLVLLGEYKQSHAVTAVEALALARFVEWLRFVTH